MNMNTIRKPYYQFSRLIDFTATTLINSCNTMREILQVHGQMVTRGETGDPNNLGRIVYLFIESKFRNLGYAELLFYHSDNLNTFIWNTMIKGYTAEHLPERAFSLYSLMLQKSFKPDNYTYPFLLKACMGFSQFRTGKQVHGQSGFHTDALKLYLDMRIVGFEVNEITIVSVLSSCTKLQEFKEGEKVHAHMIKSGLKGLDTKLKNGLVYLYAGCRRMDSALELFRESDQDVVAWCALIVGFARSGFVDFSRRLFDKMPHRDAIAWGTMISSYTNCERLNEALNLFKELECSQIEPEEASMSGFHTDALKLYLDMRIVGVEVNEITIVSVLSSCTKLQEFNEGEKVHAHMIKSGLKGLNAKLKNGLVYLYAGCRRMDSALQLFRESDQDVVAWCALIVGFARSGFVDFSRRLFDKMPHRDAIAWGTMISSYTNCERLNEALNLFKELECSQKSSLRRHPW
ncbi:hypothetical protein AMTR_s00066p00090800 [Amborella trichopoda]|uniref:Pentacotripeptide-repeat region of PRORP domain-containing protein n=1 Tax=Amborella trichopoda TaxID=13333 RepID=U5DD67_AMBTC|nr:hypothetical protein AMTR_s00066p00090800 [Amborella trichopoda]